MLNPIRLHGGLRFLFFSRMSTKLESSKPECKGDPESALNDDEMIAKARDLIRFGGINDPAPVIEGVMGMSQGGNSLNVSSLLASAA